MPDKAVVWEVLSVYRDGRGMVFEPLEEGLLGRQRNVHVVVNRPGAVRGNHCHREATEYITVVGPARVCYRQDAETGTVMVAAQTVMRFCFPPGVPHAILNTGDSDQVLVAFTDRPHDPLAPDTLPHELIAPE